MKDKIKNFVIRLLLLASISIVLFCVVKYELYCITTSYYYNGIKTIIVESCWLIAFICFVLFFDKIKLFYHKYIEDKE